MKMTLNILIVVAVIGLLFSGYLSYLEFTGQPSCNINLGVPPCVLGFIMYLIIIILALLTRKGSPAKPS